MKNETTRSTGTFTLKSNDLGGQFVKAQFASADFGGPGANISPALHWENAPEGTQAFTVTLYDLDAPTGSGLWHWVVNNIPASVTSLASDAGNPSHPGLPEGAVSGLNDLGVKGYVGPCPPAGELHRYQITVYALKELLQTAETTGPALTGFMLNSMTLAKASLLVYAKQD